MPTTREVLARRVRHRAVKTLDRLIEDASPNLLEATLGSSTDFGSVALLLNRMAPHEEWLAEAEPLAESLVRGAALKEEIIREAGGVLETVEVADLLGISPQAVRQRRRRGQLLAVRHGRGYVFPACQFDREGHRVLHGLRDVLDAFPPAVESDWMRLSALLGRTGVLQGRNIIEALRDGDVEAARGVAASTGQG